MTERIETIIYLDNIQKNFKEKMPISLQHQNFKEAHFFSDLNALKKFCQKDSQKSFLVICNPDFCHFDLNYFISQTTSPVSTILEYSLNNRQKLVHLDDNGIIESYQTQDEFFYDGLIPSKIFFFKNGNYLTKKIELLTNKISIDIQGVPAPKFNNTVITKERIPAIFLDRDGVINFDTGHPHQIENIIIHPKVIFLIKEANKRKIPVIVITNQSGIAQKLFSECDVKKLNANINRLLQKDGAKVDEWYHCQFHPQKGIDEYKKTSILRKPMPGMVLISAGDYPIDISKSFMIGDKTSDQLKFIGLNTFLIQRQYDLSNAQAPVFDDLEVITNQIMEIMVPAVNPKIVRHH